MEEHVVHVVIRYDRESHDITIDHVGVSLAELDGIMYNIYCAGIEAFSNQVEAEMLDDDTEGYD